MSEIVVAAKPAARTAEEVRRRTLLVVGIVATVLIVDQLTKIWVKTHMTIGEAFGPGWFLVHFVENEGAAFGTSFGGSWGKVLLTLVRVVAIGGLVYLLRTMIHKRETKAGLLVVFGLITAGAIGNVIDSMFYGLVFSASTYGEVATWVPFGEGYTTVLKGHVVDMLHFPLIDTVWPAWVPVVGGSRLEFFKYIFNVADAAISVGVACLLLFYRGTLK